MNPLNKTPNTHLKQDILFYDGSCPLCAKEIQWLEKIQQKRASRSLQLQNIHSFGIKDRHIQESHAQNGTQYPPLPNSSSLDEPSDTKAQMLQTLHLLTANQEWKLGLDATVHAWSHTPYGFLLRPLRWPLIKTIADTLYTRWAKKRYQRRYYCEPCSDNRVWVISAWSIIIWFIKIVYSVMLPKLFCEFLSLYHHSAFHYLPNTSYKPSRKPPH